jgi:hypothetical protein
VNTPFLNRVLATPCKQGPTTRQGYEGLWTRQQGSTRSLSAVPRRESRAGFEIRLDDVKELQTASNTGMISPVAPLDRKNTPKTIWEPGSHALCLWDFALSEDPLCERDTMVLL